MILQPTQLAHSQGGTARLLSFFRLPISLAHPAAAAIHLKLGTGICVPARPHPECRPNSLSENLDSQPSLGEAAYRQSASKSEQPAKTMPPKSHGQTSLILNNRVKKLFMCRGRTEHPMLGGKSSSSETGISPAQALAALSSGNANETPYKSAGAHSSEIHQRSDCCRVARGGWPRSARSRKH